MKKNISILLANVTESGVFSCNKRADNKKSRSEKIARQEIDATYIRAGLWPVAYTIPPKTKQLKSVAFFVETSQGKFYKFLSTEPLKSKYGFEELTKIGNTYTAATFKLKEGQEGNNKITVVGNYDENNLTDVLKSAKCIDDVMKIKAYNSNSGQKDALLMFDHKIIDIETDENE